MDEEPGERTPVLGAGNSPSVRAHSGSPRRGGQAMYERASARWWNPQFSSASLEAQYWRCSFSQLRDRFQTGLIYIGGITLIWTIYLFLFEKAGYQHGIIALGMVITSGVIFAFTFFSPQYQRFYMPTSFLCTFLIIVVSLVIFSAKESFMTPLASLATSFQVILLIYTVIPLPLYCCIVAGGFYSLLYELLTGQREMEGEIPFLKCLLHFGVHCLGVHLYILTQIRQRKTFLKVGQSLLARKDLELETQFKDHMIQSVMPKKVAEELLKDAGELRRPSASQDSNHRTSNGTTVEDAESAFNGVVLPKSIPETRKFRPFTMNLMTDVSILFADIAGFTKMSTNKSADELVNLLNDLFGRFDNLCRICGLEKISTLGDCYYCVAGCPEPCDDHAKRTVEMGLEMIVAIAQFDIDRGQEVNMRVGIHTGKVMCGMVGTKRFKFDVFSNDVTLANEMESSGVAGRVHVSEATAKFLTEDYILDPGDNYSGPYRIQVQGTEKKVKPASMKTFFIAGRKKEPVDAGSLREKENSAQSLQKNSSFKKINFKQKLAGKLKMGHTNSYPVRANSGSLRIKLAERNRSTQLLPKESNSICVMEDNRKSASLQALATAESHFHGSTPETRNSYTENIGSQPAPAGGSGSNSMKGSRSSGLQLSLQDGNSDLASVGGLDTAISHHHNAASLTRFDTDNKDFDQRLAMVISQGEIGFDKRFWGHHNSLNKWTLKFNEKEVEEEYRAHFADSSEKGHIVKQTAIGQHQENMQRHTIDYKHRYRYSGVFTDIAVSGIMFVIVALTVFFFTPQISQRFIIYVSVASTLLVAALGLIGFPLLSRREILPCVNIWGPRHIVGALLMALPVGVALCIIPLCDADSCPGQNLLVARLIFAYITILSLFAHCNFSQLGAWPKTFQCILVGFIFVASVYYCQSNIMDNIDVVSCSNSTSSKINPLSSSMLRNTFGSPFFIYEIILDVFLCTVLVGFLNYQFETAFRMSFFGDVQARRDTERMQIVRDQADWLLNNVIPAHAVESLKTDTKYSENHESTAVLFASITNWNDMYEENYEGGREFIRVLNEVIGDFDELLDRPEFCHIEKIKTIGAAYMAASGLNPERKKNMQDPKEHLYQMVEFTLALQNQLSIFNEDLLNFAFVCKLGLNIGPVTAGVIGTTKLYYDIWGDTVNVASRMYSCGVLNRIQVSEHTKKLLEDRYDFEYRDHIEVKGIDGGMDTYLLVGRKADSMGIPAQIRDTVDKNHEF